MQTAKSIGMKRWCVNQLYKFPVLFLYQNNKMDLFSDEFDVTTTRGKLTALAPFHEVVVLDVELPGITALLCNCANLLPLVMSTIDVVSTKTMW